MSKPVKIATGLANKLIEAHEEKIPGMFSCADSFDNPLYYDYEKCQSPFSFNIINKTGHLNCSLVFLIFTTFTIELKNIWA